VSDVITEAGPATAAPSPPAPADTAPRGPGPKDLEACRAEEDALLAAPSSGVPAEPRQPTMYRLDPKSGRVHADWAQTCAPGAAALAHVDGLAAEAPTAQAAAALWKQSPARALIYDITVLNDLWAIPELDTERLLQVIGERVNPGRAPGSTLIPGERLGSWHPAADEEHSEGDEHVLGLDMLLRPRLGSQRGAALGWLLKSADQAWRYSAGGYPQDLREELPPAVALAHSDENPSRKDNELHAEIEQVLLQLAGCIAHAAPQRLLIPARWALARWLWRVLAASPFHPPASPALLAMLRAQLPTPLPTPDHPLDPLAVAAPDEPNPGASSQTVPSAVQRVHDLFFIAGAGWAAKSPKPFYCRPVIDHLRVIAKRPCDDWDRAAEAALVADPEKTGWRFARHLALPWAARWLITARLGERWLAEATSDEKYGQLIVDEVAAALRDPTTGADWLGKAVLDEGPTLGAPAAQALTRAWEEMAAAARPGWPAALAGAGLLKWLDPQQRARAVELASTAGEWAPIALDAIARTAEAGRFGDEALTALLELAAAEPTPLPVARNAMLRAVLVLDDRVVRVGRGGAIGAALARANQIASTPRFREHARVRAGLERLR
jgi:hypothetical protein